MKAIITGVCGQDGAYLAQLLLEKGYEVTGWARRNSPKVGLAYLGIRDRITLVDIDICDTFHVAEEIKKTKPDEIYNLAAQSHVGMSFNNPMQTCAVNYGGYLNVLIGARQHAPDCKIYQAGTSEMFGYAAEGRANEQTPLAPMSPYAISKTAAYWAGVNARYEANQFVANGILFNHESPLRGRDFVTRKITDFVKSFTGSEVLELGNLSSQRDWGHAKDYVEAMYLMMQVPADNFVIATGRATTVRRFVELAFQRINKQVLWHGEGVNEVGWINGKPVIQVSSKFYRPNDLVYLQGDPSKARKLLGWYPKITLEELVKEMVDA